LRTLISLMAM